MSNQRLESEIEHITESVCDNLLDMKVKKSVLPSPSIAAAAVSRQVRLRGGWNGAVLVECSEALARRAAGTTFAIDPATATSDDIEDVVGELANMVGGNMKALLPGPTQLSVPEEGDPDAAPARCVVSFEADGQPLTVTVLEEEEPA